MENEKDDVKAIKDDVYGLKVIRGCTSKGCIYLVVAIVVIAIIVVYLIITKVLR